jgi:thiol-disulfide isomerase/thioredoxin
MKLILKFLFAILFLGALALVFLYFSGELSFGIAQWEMKADYNFSGKKLNRILNEHGIETKSSEQLILINFWEPYCGHCVLELPDLNKLYQRCSAFNPDFYAVCAVDSAEAERELKKDHFKILFKKRYATKGLRFDLRTIHDGKEPEDDALPQTYVVKGGDSIIYFKMGRLSKEDLDSVYHLISG